MHWMLSSGTRADRSSGSSAEAFRKEILNCQKSEVDAGDLEFDRSELECGEPKELSDFWFDIIRPFLSSCDKNSWKRQGKSVVFCFLEQIVFCVARR